MRRSNGLHGCAEFLGIDHAVAIGIDAVETFTDMGEEFLAADFAIFVGVHPLEHVAHHPLGVGAGAVALGTIALGAVAAGPLGIAFAGRATWTVALAFACFTLGAALGEAFFHGGLVLFKGYAFRIDRIENFLKASLELLGHFVEREQAVFVFIEPLEHALGELAGIALRTAFATFATRGTTLTTGRATFTTFTLTAWGTTFAIAGRRAIAFATFATGRTAFAFTTWGTGGFELFERDFAVAIGIDIAEMLGHAAGGFFFADGAVAIFVVPFKESGGIETPGRAFRPLAPFGRLGYQRGGGRRRQKKREGEKCLTHGLFLWVEHASYSLM